MAKLLKSSANDEPENENGNPAAKFRDSGWIGFVAAGIVLVACGIGAFLSPDISTIMASKVLGSMLAFAGLVCVIQAMTVKEWPGFNWQLILGAAEIVGGIFIIISPLKGAAAVTLIIAIIIGAQGISQAGLALRIRPIEGWGWLLLAGIASLLIAMALVMRFPFALADSPGGMAGIALAFGGLAYVMVGLGRRRTLANQPE